jgi:hypothetical protein
MAKLYYFAIVSSLTKFVTMFLLTAITMLPKITNILLRFSWLIYVPTNGPSMAIRSFVTGILEILRRWQWNFCACIAIIVCGPSHTTAVDRVENEQLGNMDQYRVTREVPLPYSLDHDDPAQLDGGSGSDGSDNDLKHESNRSKQRGRTISPVTRPTTEVIDLQ